MKKIILISLATFFMISCKTSRVTSDKDKSTKDTTVDKTTTIRPGEVITIDIPNIRFKDTIIRRTNYETKSVATVYYDKEGNQRFDCQTAEIAEMRELLKETIQNDIQNNEDLKRSFNPQYFIYALAAFALVICVLFYMVIRIQNKMPEMTAKLVRDLLNSKQ